MVRPLRKQRLLEKIDLSSYVMAVNNIIRFTFDSAFIKVS
jgi:hypothetical protein